ncbi:MAG: ParM/StbA family protein [Chloroflexi bacterium]|nr:ParM/StbA family protein [Chloroflexota bacterium]
MKQILILDAGNSIIKARLGNNEITFPHALRRLTETEYRQVLDRSGPQGPPPDYLRVNTEYYVIGESAERHGTVTRRTGAARYTRDYYGVFVAAALSRLTEWGMNMSVFGSHPPGDVIYRDNLMESAVGDWTVEMSGRERRFRVTYVNTFEEPVGGLMNLLLTEDGRNFQRTDLSGRTLVIDIGGHTTDWLAVNPGGAIDYSLSESTPIGILEVFRDFERSFRANHRDAVRGLTKLPPDRVRNAVATGIFLGGGEEFPCEAEVNEATSTLLNRISDTYQNLAGGPLPWDSIVLTGGGSAILYSRLLPVLKHKSVILADEPDMIHLANVRGGSKLWHLYEMMGIL